MAIHYIMYSGVNYEGPRNVTEEEITKIYQQELFNIRKPGQYMRIWQFHQAAEVLQRPIRSIYPGGTNPRLRRDLNQMILPNLDIASDKTPVYIIWTPLHIYSRPYDVKHSVPLLRKAVCIYFSGPYKFFVTIFVTIFIANFIAILYFHNIFITYL